MQKSEIVQQKQNANELQQQLSPTSKEKLSSAEIQRRKINAASEYYRKLREEANKNSNQNTSSDNTMSPTKPETPPMQPPPRTPPAPTAAATVVTIAAAPAQVLGPPPPLIPNDSNRISLPVIISKPNIDLGEVVRSTIINGVTKQFSQVLFLYLNL